MIVADLLPLWIVEGKGFQELVQLIDPAYSMLSQQQLKQNALPWYVKTVQEKIRVALKGMDSFVLTIDVWDFSPLQSYLGFTVSFLSSQWQPKTIVLACCYIVGYEGFQKIPLLIQELFKAYGIQNLLYCTIVNKNYSQSSGLLLGASDNNYDDTEPEYDINFEVGSTYTKAFSGLLFASIHEGLMKGLVPYKHVLEVVGQAVADVRKCPNTTESVFAKDFGALGTDVKWILHLQLIRCLLNYNPEQEATATTSEGDILKMNLFSESDRAILTEIVAILELFEEAVNIMHEEKHFPISLCLPSLISLKTHLTARSTGICSHLAVSLSSVLDKNCDGFTSNPLYVCSAVLDPRFKLSWCNDATECENYKQIVLQEAQKVFDATPTTTTTNNSSSSSSSTTAVDISLSKSKLFSFISNSSSSQSSSLTPQLELESYLKDDHGENDPFAYWKIRSGFYPTLAKLARYILCVPATPTPINKVFDYAARIIYADDPTLSFPEHFEILLFLKASMSEFQFF